MNYKIYNLRITDHCGEREALLVALDRLQPAWTERGRGREGEIVSWAWVKHPREAHPSDEPFAWAMIKLDGADVPMVSWVRAAAEDAVQTGARVRAVWAEETIGFMTDLNGFELV